MFGRQRRRRARLAEMLESQAQIARLAAAVVDGAQTLVDGDAVCSLGWPHLSVDVRRHALVDYLGAFADTVAVDQAAIRVFFDQTMGETVPRSRALTIELVEDRTAGAVRAIEEIEAGDSTVAIWNDDPNAVSLRAAGATVFAPDVLLDRFLDLDPEGL